MSDQQRLTSPAPRGHLSRATNTTNTSAPRTSKIPTPRRTSRARADPEKTPTKSSIPTPRRQSRLAEPSNETSRRMSRTPVKSPATRLSLSRHTPSTAPATPAKTPTTPSSIRTPRRTSTNPSASAEMTPRSRAAASFRRQSNTGDSQKPITPQYRSRLSSSNAPDKSRGLPDRSTPSLIPSPATRRTSTAGGGSQRPALQASPYARRSSGAGAAGRTSGIGAPGRTAGTASAGRTSYGNSGRVSGVGATGRVSGVGATGRVSGVGATGRVSGVGATGRTSNIGSAAKRRSGAAAGARRTSGIPRGRLATGVTRKLNMAPGAEGDENPSKRRVSGIARKTGVAMEDGMHSRLDRIDKKKERMASDVPRRESGGRRTGGPSALESFRAVRRASMDSTEGSGKEAVEPMQIEMRPEQATEEKKDGEATVEDVKKPEQESEEKPTEVEKMPKESQSLPDRADPITAPDKLAYFRTPAKGRRTSDRFGDVNINLDNVERLRKSLGRRRSKGPYEDISKIETPKLRKLASSSQPTALDLANSENAGNAGNEQSASGEAIGNRVVVDSQETGPDQTREPLRSIEINASSEGKTDLADDAGSKAEKGTPKQKTTPVPQLDGDDAWENEEVEDLGLF